MTRQRRIGRAVAGTAAVLTTTLALGCGSPEPSNEGKPPAGNQVSTQNSAQAPQRLAGGKSGRTCKTAEVKLSLGRGEGAAGTVFRPLRFTNTSNSSCTMIGYPGVSYVTGANGRQVGAAAVRTGGKRVLVTLAPGETASATVGFTQVDNFDPAACKKTPVRGLRVYPPNNTASKFIANPGFGCAGKVPGAQLKVKRVVKGPTGQ